MCPATKVGRKKKLRGDLFQVPYTMLDIPNSENVLIDMNDGMSKLVHVNRLKPAKRRRTEESATLTEQSNSPQDSSENGTPQKESELSGQVPVEDSPPQARQLNWQRRGPGKRVSKPAVQFGQPREPERKGPKGN